jgi:hypothetical protein
VLQIGVGQPAASLAPEPAVEIADSVKFQI